MIPYHPPQLLDAADTPWITSIVDVACAARGQPWRVLLDRIDRLPLSARARPLAAIISALRRTLVAGKQRASAREVRKRVLGSPALVPGARTDRIASVANWLAVTPETIEQLLWSDLARERLVVLPDGRPSEQALAAIANVELLQRLVRRALHVRIVAWGDPRVLARIVAKRGLLAAVTATSPIATAIDITGPLSLFHDTTVYGHALAALIPPLAALERFELEIRCDLGRGQGIVQLAPPILLPAAPTPRRSATALDARLARDLAALDPEVEIDRDPAPIVAGDRMLFPDLAIVRGSHRRLIEILGFATADYLADKLARYAAAGASVLLCVDAARSPMTPTPHVLPFTRRISATEVLERLGDSG